MGKILSTMKGKIIAGILAGVTITVVVVVVFVLLKDEGYRTIVAKEINGTALLSNESKNNADIYAGQHLYNGDSVDVSKESYLLLELDMDKYVLAEEDTKFKLEASGKKGSTKTVIHLKEGSVLNRLKSNLDTDENYETSTPNATISVRGTVFRVTVYIGTDGLNYTRLEVFNGVVEVSLKTEDGEYNGVVKKFYEGESVLIRGNSEFAEFVEDENGEIVSEIEYSKLPKITAEKLVEFADDGEVYAITKELLMHYTMLVEHEINEKVLVEAKCEETGKIERICSVCGEEKETIEIPPIGHKEGEWVVTKESTCTENGLEEQKCAVCDKKIGSRQIQKKPHVEGAHEIIKGQEATCNTAGSERIRCAVCNEIIRVKEVSPVGHKSGQWITVKEATCVDAGKQQKKCSVCDAVIDTREVKALGHTPGGWKTIKEATCTKKGEKVKACTVCNAIVESKEITLTHSWTHDKAIEMIDENLWYVDATCERENCKFFKQPQQHKLEENEKGTALNCITCGTSRVHVHNITTTHYIGDVCYEETSCTGNGTAQGCGKGMTVEVEIKHICNQLPVLDGETDGSVVSEDVICLKCSESIFEGDNSTSGAAGEHIIRASRSDADGRLIYVCDICGELKEGSLIVNVEKNDSEFFVYGQDSASGEFKVSGISEIGYNQLSEYNSNETVSITLPEAYIDEDGVVYTITDFEYIVNYGAENKLLDTLCNQDMPYQEWIVPEGYKDFTGFSGFTELGSDTVINLKNIDFGQIERIAEGAFENAASIERVDIPASSIEIGANAFKNCTSLRELNIEEGFNGILGTNAFSNSLIKEVVLPYSMVNINNNAFGDSNETSNLEIIRWDVNHNEAISSIQSALPNYPVIQFVDGNYMQCGEGAEKCIAQTEDGVVAVIDSGNVVLGEDEKLAYENIYIDEGVDSLASYMFAECSAKNITLPSTLQVIGEGVFNASKIAGIEISGTVKSIGHYAFKDCTELAEVTFTEDFAGTIGIEAFKGCTKLTSIDIPAGVQSIEADAFSNCTSLSSVTLKEGFVGETQFYLFMNCPLLTSVEIPSTMTNLGAIFANSDITGIEIPSTVTDVYDYALSGCEDLTEIKFADGFAGTIGKFAFENCRSLSSVIFNGVTYTDNTALRAAMEGAGISCESDFFGN